MYGAKTSPAFSAVFGAMAPWLRPAVADTLYCAIADEKEQALQSEADVAEMEAEFELGMKMLIKGALVHL